MCLYPRLIKNRKYLPNKKNGGIAPPIIDKRTTLVPVGCGKCMECKKQKARAWQVRLLEEMREQTKHRHFVTLTFSDEKYIEIGEKIKGLDGYNRENQIATYAMRKFLERWRKKFKTSVKHWFVTELGHKNTKHIHLHGIIWTDKPHEIEERWGNGYVHIGEYVNEQTISYISKYIYKMDFEHKMYDAKILTSKGIGKNYINRIDANSNKYQENEKTEEYYQTRTGHKMNLPIYYRNKIYSEEEREKLWIEKLNKEIRYVDGRKIDISKTMFYYLQALKEARKKSNELGYGNAEKNWELKEYENQIRNELYEKRWNKVKNKEETEEIEEIEKTEEDKNLANIKKEEIAIYNYIKNTKLEEIEW